MKARELMIGDWVYGKKAPDIPFKLIAPLGAKTLDGKLTLFGETINGIMVGPFLEDEINPIPLTPEILEKNGFKKKHPTQHFCEIVIGSFRITVQFGYGNNVDYVRIYETPNDNYIPETNINIYHPKIKYIHQLQHALRLCGIDKEIML